MDPTSPDRPSLEDCVLEMLSLQRLSLTADQDEQTEKMIELRKKAPMGYLYAAVRLSNKFLSVLVDTEMGPKQSDEKPEDRAARRVRIAERLLDALELQVVSVGKENVPDPWWPAELDEPWVEPHP